MTQTNFQLPEELEALKSYPNWVCFQLVPDRVLADGRQHYSKKPIDPNKTNARNLYFAKANDPKTWATYDKALEAWNKNKQISGIGFQFSGTPFVGVDLDNVLDPKTGQLTNEARDIVGTLQSYTEFSPSGHGLHILIPGNMPEGRRRKGNLEMYGDGRFFTVTGKNAGNYLLDPTPNPKIQERINQVHAKYFSDPEKKNQNFMEWNDVISFEQDIEVPAEPENRSLYFSDNERLQEMLQSQAGPKIRALLNGDMSAFNNDHSGADQALANYLVWFCWHDLNQADRLFRRSNLMRDKWDEIHDPAHKRTYGQMTLEQASKQNKREFRPRSQSTVAPAQRQQPTPAGQPQNQAGQMKTGPEVSQAEQRKNELKAFIQDQRTDARMQDFVDHINESKNNHEISTGFQALDAVLDGGLYVGLYTIGAISSLGKTTFAMQIADHIARSGRPVAIVSMEMGRDELIGKSISRMTYQRAETDFKDTRAAKTARGVLNGRRWQGYTDAAGKQWPPYSKTEVNLLSDCISEYESEIAPNLYIFEGNGNISPSKVTEIMNGFKALNISPILVIDYLQIMRPDDPRATDKQAVDQSVLVMKNISRDFKIPVIIVSSLNRQNYSNEISFEAFKESGALEYGSDVMIGLQLEGAGTKDFDAQAEKAKNPRRIELKILKNRFGPIPQNPLAYYFYPAFNYFKER